RELLDSKVGQRLLPEEEQSWLEIGIAQVVEGSGPKDWEAHALQTKAGLRRTINWSSKALHRPGEEGTQILLVGHDITELQEAQRLGLQAERLAAVGQVSVGLAHEGRNALQRSQACLDRLGWRLKDQPEALDLLTRAHKAQNDLVVLFEEVREYAAP